jgi:hypothetical protein
MPVQNSRKPDYGAISGVLIGLALLAGMCYAGYYVISRFVAPAVKSGAKYVGEKIDVLKLRSQIVGSWATRPGIDQRFYTFLSDGTVTAWLPSGLGSREEWAGTYEVTLAGKMILHLKAVRDSTRRIDTEEPCELESEILRIGRLLLSRTRA